MSVVEKEKKRGHVPSETLGCFAPLDLASVCQELMVLGRDRSYVIRRQRRTIQQSEQHWKSVLKDKLGPDHGMTSKELYSYVKELRNVVIRTVKPDWHGIPESDFIEVLAENSVPMMKKTKHFLRNGEAYDRLNEAELSTASAMRWSVGAEVPFLEIFSGHRETVEREMVRRSSVLPVHDWWCGMGGCNSLGLGLIVAETGDLSNYANPDKVKRRMGLAPYKGKAGSTWRMKGGLTNKEYVEMGYVPRRKSVMYTISQAIILTRGEPYYGMYLGEKERRGGKWPDARKGHIDMHARRWMEQKLLIELWARWNGVWRGRR